jgi:hypothetical protein
MTEEATLRLYASYSRPPEPLRVRLESQTERASRRVSSSTDAA